MSRIDRALRIKEGRRDVPTIADAGFGPRGGSPLQQYPHEEPDREPRKPMAPPSIRNVTAVAADASPAVRRAPHGTAPAELSARLVTSTSNGLSIEQYRRLAAVLHQEQVQSQ